jgi:pilus assembly protein CpaB
VVVAAHDIGIGTVINTGDVKRVDVPVEIIPRNAIREVENVIGKFSKVALVTGEMVMQHNLADPTNISHDLAFVLEDDLVLMAFPATDLMSNLAILQRGDLVDILVSIKEEVEVIPAEDEVDLEPVLPDEEPESTTRLFTFDAMQAVGLSAVIADIKYDDRTSTTQSLGEDLGLVGDETSQDEEVPRATDIKVRAYILALKPQDALVLKHLIDLGGTFDLVLRAPSSDQIFDLQPVISEYLIDRYELEVIR